MRDQDIISTFIWITKFEVYYSLNHQAIRFSGHKPTKVKLLTTYRDSSKRIIATFGEFPHAYIHTVLLLLF